MDNAFARKIEFEISEIDLFLESYAALLEKGQEKKIKPVETLALASLLHAFYNGIESIFLFIEKESGGKVPDGSHRHRLLLDSASRASNGRPQAISESTKNSLKAYLGFHHLYRSSPSIDFDKHKLAMLASGLFLVWENLKSDLHSFTKAAYPQQ